MKQPNTQGVYSAEVEIFDPGRRIWVTKQSPSTFFPDSWSRAQVLYEIAEGFNNRTFTQGSIWEGISPSGVKIRGHLDNAGNINTAYPLY